MSAKLTYCLILASLVLLAACGTVATPEPFGEPTEVAQAEIEAEEEEEAEPPTDTPVAATETNTPLPPTETDVPPTETPEQTEEATVEAVDEEAEEEEDSLTAMVNLLGNPERGDELFHQNQPSVGFACINCHNIDTEERLVGPGLLNIEERAATRVEGTSAVEYIHTSIVAPNEYVVEGFPENLMPQTYEDIFSDQDLYDIIAYLLTLEE
jgi:cytochrome c2